jgi:predicted house-cleaning noncanonical NTP pyrophosphatase (MazG superfamily)
VSKIVYKKLVRDKIPAIITEDGHTAVTRVLNDEEFKTALLEKLIEEATELRNAPGDVNERADIAEVLKAIDESFNLSFEMIEAARLQKADRKGTFRNKLFLEEELTND